MKVAQDFQVPPGPIIRLPQEVLVDTVPKQQQQSKELSVHSLEEQPLALSVAELASSLAAPDEVEDELLAEFTINRSVPLTWFLTLDSLQSWRPRAQAEDPADLVWLTGEDSPSEPNSAVRRLRNPPQTLDVVAKAMRKKTTTLNEAEYSLNAAWDAAFALF